MHVCMYIYIYCGYGSKVGTHQIGWLTRKMYQHLQSSVSLISTRTHMENPIMNRTPRIKLPSGNQTWQGEIHHLFIDDVPIKTSTCRKFPIATFDYQRLRGLLLLRSLGISILYWSNLHFW